jgi:D-glycero-alpha-D-manno-heptose-7-phosphate kinase
MHEERLELVSKLVHFFRPNTGFHLTTESAAPAGAGLGGSSALAIACVGALNRLVGDRYEQRKFVTIAANVESQVIKVPAGFQDYYPPLYGSVSCIHFGPDGIKREALQINTDELERRRAATIEELSHRPHEKPQELARPESVPPIALIAVVSWLCKVPG